LPNAVVPLASPVHDSPRLTARLDVHDHVSIFRVLRVEFVREIALTGKKLRGDPAYLGYVFREIEIAHRRNPVLRKPRLDGVETPPKRRQFPADFA
jgi:hypothetical protein